MLNSLKRLERPFAVELLKNGQVHLHDPANPSRELDPSEKDASCLAEWAEEGLEVNIFDKPGGCRVLWLIGDDDLDRPVLFGPDYGFAPTALVRAGLALEANQAATSFTNCYRYMPCVAEEQEILVKAILMGGYAGSPMSRGFGCMLHEVGIRLNNIREAKLVQQMASLGDENILREDPRQILKENKAQARVGRVF